MNDPMPSESRTLSILFSAATDVGKIRQINEDSYFAKDPLFVIADGMGGHNAGEYASAIAVDELSKLAEGNFVDPQALADAMVRAYERITLLYDDEDSKLRNAGTTLTLLALTFHEGAPHWLVMNLGDSRTYLIRDNELNQISVDHSVVQELIERGEITEEQARTHPYRNMITRSLGGGNDSRPDFWMIKAQVDDTFLLCSDGINGELTDLEIFDILSAYDIEHCAKALVDKAVEYGGRDNATAIVVKAFEGQKTGAGKREIFTAADLADLPQLD